MPELLEAVINVSEGRRADVIAALAAASGSPLLDVHSDADHNRSVLTLAGTTEELRVAARALASETVRLLDLRRHEGVHPRIGVLDVVPFVPLPGSSMDDAVAERDAFARWAGSELDLPCFLYGPERPLPEVRRHAFASLAPDFGPPRPHPTAGAVVVGARAVLVAYNLWLESASLEQARGIAAGLRSPVVRALAFPVGRSVQVSLNLLEPEQFGPLEAYEAVAGQATVSRAELVGLIPAAVLESVPTDRWLSLDLTRERTIEARLQRR